MSEKSEDFLSFEKALRELKMRSEELKKLVSEGEIRAFRDGDSMKFRVEDITALTAKAAGDSNLSFADSLEDADWIGKNGCVIAIAHSGPYRKAHGVDWTTFEDILAEASDYWRERHKPFWVFVS